MPSCYSSKTAAPVRPGSLSVQYARAGGGVQTVTFPANGILSAPGVLGEFDAQTGLCKLRFGTMVTAAGNEDARDGAAAKLIAASVRNPDGSEAMSYEKALTLKSGPLNAIFAVVLEINGSKPGNA